MFYQHARLLCLCLWPGLLCSSRWVTGLGLKGLITNNQKVVIVLKDSLTVFRYEFRVDHRNFVHEHAILALTWFCQYMSIGGLLYMKKIQCLELIYRPFGA